MGKFCVKAAIVSSLAIAEEDYDTTIGAPIELKRNLIARPLKKGQTPQIISEGGSLRALGEGKRVLYLFSSVPILSSIEELFCSSCNQEKENNGNEGVGNQTTAGSNSFGGGWIGNTLGAFNKGAKEMSNGSVFAGVNTLLSGADQGLEELKAKFVEKEEQLKKKMDDLKTSITNLPNDAEGIANIEDLKEKINGTLIITNAISLLLLPEAMQDSAQKMTKSLKDVLNTLENKKEDAKKSIRETIDDQFELANKALNNLSGEAKEWIKKIDEKINGSSQVVDTFANISSLATDIFSNQ